MSEQTASSDPNQVTLNIKGPSELKLSITISTSKTVLELKQAIAEKSDVAADRQRLIYSGRVLKDEDALSVYKVQNAHTVHMVKGAPKPTASGSSTTPQPLPTMQTGQTSTETLLNGPRGHGALAGLNMADLFGGANPNDPNMMQNMLSSPQFMEQMSRMMADPNLMDSIIAQSPHLQNMDPNMRRTFQSEEFRRMISNPDTLRNMMQMTATLRQAGFDPMQMGMGGMGVGMGAGGGAGMFDMFGALGGGAAARSPAASGNLFEQAATGATTASPTTGTSPTSANPTSGTNPNPNPNPNPSPFGMLDPALIQQILGAPGNQGGGNPFAALGGFGVPAPPPDPRPVQLQQLQDMGFTNAQQNIRALLACGGRVDSAIEYILNGGGLQ
ncbi:Deubiquitination-protection protein dph1 [Ceratobasidium theobromae]|uniref:Deubiquitination-protection protein dph1 n=1 Tax=Ceratobasidium theobromae TaxID=1582974 RepID=A0A5N5QCH3_9AGAM|nr:Deubiquitination-protection protein dph1 [Ceratobasidium theobromae]